MQMTRMNLNAPIVITSEKGSWLKKESRFFDLSNGKALALSVIGLSVIAIALIALSKIPPFEVL